MNAQHRRESFVTYSSLDFSELSRVIFKPGYEPMEEGDYFYHPSSKTFYSYHHENRTWKKDPAVDRNNIEEPVVALKLCPLF